MSMLEDTVDRLLRAECLPERVIEVSGSWSERLWTLLEASGLHAIAVAEEHGGSGGTISEAVAVLRIAGQHAAPVPIAESSLIYASVAAVARVIDGPIAIALRRRPGVIPSVPWATVAKSVVVVDRGEAGLDNVAVYGADAFKVVERPGLSGDPLGDVALVGEAMHSAAVSDAWRAVLAHGALARAAQMAGACERVLALVLAHAEDRVQFGRSIGRFQLVQDHIAVIAGEALAARIAVDEAAQLKAGPSADRAVAAAKIRCGIAASVISRRAHQCLGAIGFTQEHSLHIFTTRLWAWRDEYGSETYWRRQLGAQVIGSGAAELWPSITARDDCQ